MQPIFLRPISKWSLFFSSSQLTDDLFLILIDANSDIILAMNEKLEKCEMTEEEVLDCINKLMGYLQAKHAVETERIENAIYNLEDALK